MCIYRFGKFALNLSTSSALVWVSEHAKEQSKRKNQNGENRRKDNRFGISEEVLGERRIFKFKAATRISQKVFRTSGLSWPTPRSHSTWPCRLLNEDTATITRSYRILLSSIFFFNELCFNLDFDLTRRIQLNTYTVVPSLLW